MNIVLHDWVKQELLDEVTGASFRVERPPRWKFWKKPVYTHQPNCFAQSKIFYLALCTTLQQPAVDVGGTGPVADPTLMWLDPAKILKTIPVRKVRVREHPSTLFFEYVNACCDITGVEGTFDTVALLTGVENKVVASGVGYTRCVLPSDVIAIRSGKKVGGTHKYAIGIDF